MKRIIAWGSAAALVLASVSAVMAHGYHRPSINADINLARVHSETGAFANSGGNTQGALTGVEGAGGVVAVSLNKGGSYYLSTGNANATANSANFVNKEFGCNYCEGRGRGIDVDLNVARVHSETFAEANTGMNFQGASTSVTNSGFVGAGAVNWGTNLQTVTGNANATANSTNMVNVSGWSWHH